MVELWRGTWFTGDTRRLSRSPVMGRGCGRIAAPQCGAVQCRPQEGNMKETRRIDARTFTRFSACPANSCPLALSCQESVTEESPPDSFMGMGISLGKQDDVRRSKREEADTDGRAVGRQAAFPRDASRRNLHSVKSESNLKPGMKRVASVRGGLRRVDSLAVTQAFGNRQLQVSRSKSS